MGSEWARFLVDDLQRDGILRVEDGNHGEYRPRADEFVPSGVAFVRAADMDDGRVLFDSAAKINSVAKQRITKGIGAPGDVLISHKGTVGKVAFVPLDAPPFVCSPQTTFWRAIDETRLSRGYLYAFLRSPAFRAQLASRAGETDMAPYVSLTSQRTFFVTVPPIGEQRVIAAFIGVFDDKIAINRRMIEALEVTAQTLFKSWFVDFDPVRAKAAGRDSAVPGSVADLFPGPVVDSDVGPIPEGWRAASLGDVVEEVREKEDPAESPDVVYLHFSIPAFDDGQLPRPEVGETIHSIKSRVRPGTVLLSKLNPEIERVWLVDVVATDRAICSTEFLVLVPRPPFGRCYAFCLARSRDFRRALEGMVTGTSKSHQRVEVGSMLSIATVRPPTPIIERFEGVAEPLFARALACRRESRTLAALRDTLLPKLISGELRIKDAERFVEAAV